MLYPRHLSGPLLNALSDTPVVVLHGARQTGKSTLAQSLARGKHAAQYLTLDDLGVLGAAKQDPEGFIGGLSGPVVIDEIQRAPELLLAIKADVDRHRIPGRFLLTGSAHVLHIPRLADALVGRMEVLTLWPLSQGELDRRKECFVDHLFSDMPFPYSTTRGPSRDSIFRRVVQGGFPEITHRTKAERRRAWFDAYLNTIMQRDVRDLSNISGLAEMPRLLNILAARAGGLINYADLARDAGLNQVTLKKYFTLLASVFLIVSVRPWYSNRIKRLMKSEKLYLADTGLLAHLLGVEWDDLGKDTHAKGALLENFVAVEFLKQLGWSRTRPQMFHYRHYFGEEVDFLLESPGRKKIVGIEVKAAKTIQPGDFKAMRSLAEAVGTTFHRGIVLYMGDQIIPIAANLHAVPIHYLWTATAK
ncbi:MAG: ATP-binding protein [Candidatus Hydrogenedentes bacterium]|nr:ATP-binding protein [Candidatus Hydrogenedentota bacterium]